MNQNDDEYEPTAEDLRILREWLKKMPHIIQDYDDKFLQVFVRGCKGSLQKTKTILEKFNSLGHRFPEFFGHLDIYDQTAQKCLKEVMPVILPKRLDDGSRIYIIAMDFKDTESKKLHFFELWRYWQMIFYMQAWEGNAGGKTIMIFDWNTLKLGHAKDITPVIVMRLVETVKSVPTRLRAVYHVNVPPAIEWSLNLAKSVLKKKIADRFYFISSMDTLYESIPREILPKDYGGNEDDLKTLHSRWMKKVESNRDRLVEVSTRMRKLDPLRPKDNESQDMVGTFKALNVD